MLHFVQAVGNGSRVHWLQNSDHVVGLFDSWLRWVRPYNYGDCLQGKNYDAGTIIGLWKGLSVPSEAAVGGVQNRRSAGTVRIHCVARFGFFKRIASHCC